MIIEKLRYSFFQYGWQLPVLIPPAFMLGRGIGNSILGIYYLWALAALRRNDFIRDEPVLKTWVFVIFAFGMSIISAVDMAKTFEDWFQFSVHSGVFFISLAMLAHSRDNFRILSVRMGQMAIAVVVITYAQYFIRGSKYGFELSNLAHTAWLAFTLPFAIVLLAGIRQRYARYLSISILLILSMVLVVLADSRSEVVIVSFIILLLWYFKTKMKWLPVMLLVISVPAISTMHYKSFDKITNIKSSGELYAVMDEMSSWRLGIWKTAFTQPPDNQITGVGMGHAHMSVAAKKYNVKHLHNFIVDVWYETGWLGVCALLLWLGQIIRLTYAGFRNLDTEQQFQVLPWLAGSGAVLLASSLDRHYQVVDFAFFLPLCLSVGYYYACKRTRVL